MAEFVLFGTIFVFLPAFLLYSAGFFLGSSGPVWARWVYVLGLPAAIAACGAYLTSVADQGETGAFISEQIIVALLTMIITPIALLANVIGVLVGFAEAKRNRRTLPSA